jgi:hypothetical protein
LKNKKISETLNHIRPLAKWSLSGDSIDGLNWLDTNTEKPTQQELDEGWISLQAKIESDAAQAQAKREAALAKLAALGLEPDDLKALGL